MSCKKKIVPIPIPIPIDDEKIALPTPAPGKCLPVYYITASPFTTSDDTTTFIYDTTTNLVKEIIEKIGGVPEEKSSVVTYNDSSQIVKIQSGNEEENFKWENGLLMVYTRGESATYFAYDSLGRMIEAIEKYQTIVRSRTVYKYDQGKSVKEVLYYYIDDLTKREILDRRELYEEYDDKIYYLSSILPIKDYIFKNGLYQQNPLKKIS